MKATGIVRRIDDLGRVVVPKEIRRVLRIREGDPLEIYTGGAGEVILKKYSPINELSQFADEYAETASKVLGATIIVSDTDQVISAWGTGKKDFADKEKIADKFGLIEYPKYYLPKEYDYLICDTGVSLDNPGEQVMTHGGMTIDEVVVPFIKIKAVQNNG